MGRLGRWFNGERMQRRARTMMVLLFTVITALALLPQPELPISTSWDKADHCLAFAALSAVGLRAWAHVPAPGRRALILLSALLAYGVAIELLQSLIPGRHASVLDVVSDVMGMALGSLSYVLARQFLPHGLNATASPQAG